MSTPNKLDIPWVQEVERHLLQMIPGASNPSERTIGHIKFKGGYLSLLFSKAGREGALGTSLQMAYYEERSYVEGHGHTMHPRKLPPTLFSVRTPDPAEAAQTLFNAAEGAFFIHMGE
jgi:hypothetical protein